MATLPEAITSQVPGGASPWLTGQDTEMLPVLPAPLVAWSLGAAHQDRPAEQGGTSDAALHHADCAAGHAVVEGGTRPASLAGCRKA